MKFYSQYIVQRVRSERQRGQSTAQLAKHFSVPEATISRWVHDISFSSSSFRFARRQLAQGKSFFALSIPTASLPRNKQTARILVSLLYWCEGSKYPSSTVVTFSNSDRRLIIMFLQLLRHGFKLDEQKLRVHLQLHSTHPR